MRLIKISLFTLASNHDMAKRDKIRTQTAQTLALIICHSSIVIMV